MSKPSGVTRKVDTEASVADSMPESVRRAFTKKAPPTAAAASKFDGLNTLNNKKNFDFLKYSKNEHGPRSLPQTYLEDFRTASGIITKNDKSHKVDVATLKKRISIVNPSITEKDILNIANHHHQITDEHYNELCQEFDLEDHDPIAGALKLLDDGNGSIDFEIVNKFFETLGHEKLEEKDIEILHEFLDINKDGKIGVDDFAKIFEHFGR